MIQIKLNRTEAALIAAFLDDLHDVYENEGSNDFNLPDTLDNRTILTYASNRAPEIVEESGVSKLAASNIELTAYLRDTIMERLGIKDVSDLPYVH